MKKKLANIDISMLNTFLCTAKNNNMSQTAKDLNVTQPAVSTAIQKLEAIFGVALFDRSARPMRLTPAGRILNKKAEALINDLEHLVCFMQETTREHQIDLRLGFSDSYSGCVSPSLLYRLALSVNNLSAYTSSTPGIIRKFKSGEVDIVVATRNLCEDRAVCSMLLLTERFVVATPMKYQGKINCAKDITAMAQEIPIIRFNDDSLDSVQVERVLRQCNAQSAKRIEADTNLSVLSFVQHGIGWTVMPPLGIMMARSQIPGVAFHDVLNATRSFYVLYKEPIFEGYAKTIAKESEQILRDKILPQMKQEVPMLCNCVQINNRIVKLKDSQIL